MFWSHHQPHGPTAASFEGNLDLAAFVREAQANSLLVLLRIGPYCDAETDFGALPGWLLHQKVREIRTNQTQFVGLVRSWWERYLFPVVRPLLFSNGGPVVMVQIENEFGAFSSGTAADSDYMQQLVGMVRSGLGPSILLYTTDGDRLPEMARGSLKGSRVYSVPDFGPGGLLCAATCWYAAATGVLLLVCYYCWCATAGVLLLYYWCVWTRNHAVTGDPDFGGREEITAAFEAQRVMNLPGLCPLMCSELYV